MKTSSEGQDTIFVVARAVMALLLLAAMGYLLLGADPLGGGLASRIEAGKNLRPLDYARAYGWWMTAVNALALVLVLWQSTRLRGLPAHRRLPEFAAPTGRIPTPLRWAVALAMLTLAVLAAPRLDDALWTDEKYMVMRSIAGFYEHEHGPDSELVFNPVTWPETFFYYRKPNNHVPYSVAARLTWETWKAIEQPSDQRAAEQAVRLPALLAGMAGIGTLAWVLWRLGFAWAAALAAWILALHPWFLRYASEARGYTLMMALLPVSLAFAYRVLERGSWRRWAAYGAVQVVLLWTYPGAIFVPVLLNSWLAYQLLTRGHEAGTPTAARLPALSRFLAANTASALVWLQFNLPNMMQFLAYSKEWQGDITTHFLRETGSLLLLGLHDVPAYDAYISLASVAADHPALLPSLVGIAILSIFLGIGILLRAGAPARGSLLLLLLPALCTLGFAAVRGDHLYPWYVIHLLPGLVAVMAVGLTGATRSLTGEGIRSSALAVVMISFLATFTWVTQPMRHLLRARDVQPVVAMLQKFGWPPDADPLAPRPFLTGAIYGPPIYYDPGAVFAHDAVELRELIEKADRTDKVLYVSYNRERLAERRTPEAMAMVRDPEVFEPMGRFDGVYPKYERYVFRYRPGSLAGSPRKPSASAAPK